MSRLKVKEQARERRTCLLLISECARQHTLDRVVSKFLQKLNTLRAFAVLCSVFGRESYTKKQLKHRSFDCDSRLDYYELMFDNLVSSR